MLALSNSVLCQTKALRELALFANLYLTLGTGQQILIKILYLTDCKKHRRYKRKYILKVLTPLPLATIDLHFIIFCFWFSGLIQMGKLHVDDQLSDLNSKPMEVGP